MNIAFGAWLYRSGEPSGASRRAAGLLRALAEQLPPEHNITVLHGSGLDPVTWTDAATAERLRWREVPIPAGPTWRRWAAERRVLASVLREIDADLVELGAMPIPSGLPCPVTLTLHDLRDLDGVRRRFWPLGWKRTLIARSLARCTLVTTPSQFTADRLTAHRLVERTEPRVAVVPGGVVRESIRARPPGGVDPMTTLHVGHLETRKGLQVLVQAVAILATRGHERARLRLVGADHGAGRSLVALAARLGITDRVRFEGRVDESVLLEAYRTATVIAIPSSYEGFGLPALEALAHGAPLVVRDAGSLPEVVGDAAPVLATADPADWADAIAASVGHDIDATQRRLERARSLCWDTAAGHMLALWRERFEVSA